MGPTQKIQTFGEVFPQFKVELVASDVPTEPLKLLFWDGERARVDSIVQLEDAPGSGRAPRAFVAPEINPTIQKRMRFPTSAIPYESDRKLFTDLCAVINKFTDLPEKSSSLVALSVLSSWFADCIAVPMCLWIAGARLDEGHRLLQLLNCLYRRPLLFGEITMADLCSLPLGLRPSLLIEQWRISSGLQSYLKVIGSADGHFFSKGQFIDMRCATVICTEEPLSNFLRGRAIEISVMPADRPLPILDTQVQDKIANEFQPKLLMYRLKNLERVRNSTYDVPELTSHVRDIARCWGTFLADDANGHGEIVGLLKDVDAQVRGGGEDDLLNVIVVEAMLSFCHREKNEAVHAGEVAALANRILKRRGELLTLGPRAVANRLRELSIPPIRLDARGRGVLLFSSVRQRIHKLAWNNKLLSHRNIAPECQHCMDLCVEEKETEIAYPDRPDLTDFMDLG